MQSQPDGDYKFILNYQDHLTKYLLAFVATDDQIIIVPRPQFGDPEQTEEEEKSEENEVAENEETDQLKNIQKNNKLTKF